MDSGRACEYGRSALANKEWHSDLFEHAVQGVLFQANSVQPASAPNGYRLPVLGNSPAVQTLLDTVLHIAPTEASLLLTGETGTGKGFIANLIHLCSPRASKPFVEVVCGVLAESLVESELFGHERGAFTGATDAKPGRFELAGNGTIVLDEIGDLTPSMQVKLLRVLQDRKFERVGGTVTLSTGARIIAATNRDLRALVEAGRFREDLYYRLKVVSIEIPPLRERRADIPELVRSFLTEFGTKHRGTVPTISQEAIQGLSEHAWPGNIRSLRNCIESLVVFDRRGAIEVQDLPLEIRAVVPSAPGSLESERESLLYALLLSNGNRTSAAASFGTSRRHFYRMLRKHGL